MTIKERVMVAEEEVVMNRAEVMDVAHINKETDQTINHGTQDLLTKDHGRTSHPTLETGINLTTQHKSKRVDPVMVGVQ